MAGKTHPSLINFAHSGNSCFCGHNPDVPINGPVAEDHDYECCETVTHSRMVRSGSKFGQRDNITFKRINSTMYHATGDNAGRYFLYKTRDSNRWYLDNDQNPSVVLEQSPTKDAVCPGQLTYWLQYCNTYRYVTSSCGKHRWTKATAPRCAKGPKGNECCSNVKVTAAKNLADLPGNANQTISPDLQDFVAKSVGEYQMVDHRIQMEGLAINPMPSYIHKDCHSSLLYSVSTSSSII